MVTTVTTTSYPVTGIEFPALTICGQGSSEKILNTAMSEVFRSFIKIYNITIHESPIELEELMFSKVSTFKDLT